MLTEKQIKNLKEGDPLIIRGTFVSVDRNGDICIKSPRTVFGSVCDYDIKYVRPTMVSIEESRYDPCRKFKKGDIVSPKLVNGRSFSEQLDPLIGEKCVVGCDEVIYNFVGIWHDNRHYTIDPAYLELITPVDELEPYYIEETEYEFCVTIMVGERKDSPAIYHKRMHPHAKEAAEAECKRLNAEWRKEHNND